MNLTEVAGPSPVTQHIKRLEKERAILRRKSHQRGKTIEALQKKLARWNEKDRWDAILAEDDWND